MLHRKALLASFLLLFVPGLVGVAGAESRDASAAWVAAKAAAIERLEGLAARANRRRLFLARNEAYEAVLRFDPDHGKARSWLKYRRRDGVWVRPRYTPPRDRGSESARAEHAERMSAWRRWWRSEVLRVHRLALDTRDEGTAGDILAFALRMHPDDAALRARAGEARYGTGKRARWILADTERALKNRTRFLESANAAMRAMPKPTAGRLLACDRGDGFPWPRVLEGSMVRALGTVSRPELERHVRIAEAGPAVFRAVFGTEGRIDSEEGKFPLYVTVSRSEGNGFLATEPGIGASELAALGDFDLSFLPTRPGAVVKTDKAALRFEATAHAVHAHLLRTCVGHTEGAPGAWAGEIAGLYLVWLQLGTRRLQPIRAPAREPAREPVRGPFGRPDPEEGSEGEFLADATLDWYVQASAAIEAGGEPTLLAGYGLIVFVMESHPELSAAFLHDVAARPAADLDPVLEKHLGRDRAALRPHLLRWLAEMSELTAEER